MNFYHEFLDSPGDWLDNLLKEKLYKVDIDSTGKDVRWDYVQKCISLLETLKNCLKNQDSNQVLLSVNQQQNISSLMQLIIALGIVPSLLPGVGLPLSKRSKFFELALGGQNSNDKKDQNGVLEMHQRLVFCSKHFLDLLEVKDLRQILLTKHLGDVLASLIQLSSAPLKKPQPSETMENDLKKCEESSDEFVMTQDKYDEFCQSQDLFKKHLHGVIDKVYPPLIVKYLLVLQSCGASQAVKPVPKSINVKKSPTPKWVQAACGALLTHCLTRNQNGVLNVVQGILDVGDDADDIQRFTVIASVISNPPSTGKYKDLEEYFKLVCPQVLSILDQEDLSEKKIYHMIACHCIRSLTERSLILSRRYLLGELLEPLLRLTKDLPEETEEVVSEEEMDKCLQRLHLCFVMVNDPSFMLLSHLQPVILVLLELHCRINFGVSHLRGTVEELVQRFLRWSSKNMAISTLKAFCLGKFSCF